MAPRHNEYILGTIPHRDGTGYSPSLPTPSWAELVDLIELHDMKLLEIIFIGAGIYSGDVSKIDGISGIVERRDVTRAVFKQGEPTAVPVGPGFVRASMEVNPRQWTPIYAQRLLPKLNVGGHITAIVVRKIR